MRQSVALQQETRTIPIVFANVADPVAGGIVARLDRPSGNVTGFANNEASLGGKWLELLSEIAPGLKIVGVSGLSADDGDSTGAGGVQAFLTKPYTAQDLLLKLHAVLQTE